MDEIFPIHKKNTKRIFEKINDKELVILKEILKNKLEAYAFFNK